MTIRSPAALLRGLALVSVLSCLTTTSSAQSAVDRQSLTDVARSCGLQPDGPGRLIAGGHRYLAELSSAGLRFVPALGPAAATTRFVELRAIAVERTGEPILAAPPTEPVHEHLRASYRHTPSIEERFDAGVDGIEVSWRFDRRPAGSGDLVVRYAMTSNLPTVQRGDDGALRLVDAIGGVSIGGVTGIDARGRRVAGQLHCENGTLAMSLPARFVDEASYPIVLDPLIGTTFQVAGLNIDSEPDLAYDASNDLYLVAWLRTFSAALVVPRAQRVATSGALIGGQIMLGSTGVCGRPRVANFPARNRFGVVFDETIGTFDGVQFEAVAADTGAITHQAVVASSTGTSDLYRDPDIAGAAAAPLQSSRAFVVCFEDNIHNEIRVREIFFNTSDQLVSPSPVAVFTDTGGVFNNSYTQPAITRQSRLNSRYLIVARRFSGTGPSVSIAARSFSTSLGVEGTTSFDSSTTDELAHPDVDGQDGSWTVAWERTTPGGSTAIRRRRIEYDGNAFSLGTIENLGGSPLLATSAPSVAWSVTRTRIGYRNFSGIGPQASLRLGAINSGDSGWCDTEFSRTISTSESRIVATTEISGGRVGSEGGMAVFADNGFILAQRLRNHGSSGSLTDLGGACGVGGSQFILPQTPGIGTSSVGCNLSGLSSTALATVFNLSPANGPIGCGPCVWEPFRITSVEVPLLGTANVTFPIPCQATLVGTSYVVQWTTFDPGQSPCGLFPDVALSERVLLTIGN